MPMKDLGPRLTVIVFIYFGVLLVIITGLLITEDYYYFGESIYSHDDIEPGSIQTHHVIIDDNIMRFDLHINVLGVPDVGIDVYLVEAPDQQSEDMSQMHIIRSGVRRRGHDLDWTVGNRELGDGVLLLVVDNTDEGEVPATNATIRVITTCQSTLYQNPLFLPVTIGLILISIVFFWQMIRYYQRIK
jgi:hypothetical protein